VKSAATITRRSFLGAGLLTVAACKHGSSPSTPRVDPDSALLESIRATEETLIAGYDALLAKASGATADRLAAERAGHVQHLAALHGAEPPPGSTHRTSAPTSLRALREEIAGTGATIHDAALAAVDGTHAAILASIAASHEVMIRD
jgi:hypothetical protein